MLLEFLFLCSLASYPQIPNRDCSPGSLCTTEDQDFKEYRYSEQIPYCKRNVSSALKRAVYEEYGIPEVERSDYTIDHIIPLSIGGSNLRDNLWPEHKKVKATRPNLEQELYNKIRSGEISQAEAIEVVLTTKF